MSSRRNWDSLTPLSPASVSLPTEQKGGGANSSAGEGLGESQFRRLEKSLALCLLCAGGQLYFPAKFVHFDFLNIVTIRSLYMHLKALTDHFRGGSRVVSFDPFS